MPKKREKVTYQQARYHLERAERRYFIRLKKKFWHSLETTYGDRGWDLDEMTAEFINYVILPAVQAAKDYAKSEGYDGYLNDIEYVQRKYARGFYSKGKKFASRIYRISAMRCVLIFCSVKPYMTTSEVFIELQKLAYKGVEYDGVKSFAKAIGFMTEHYSSEARRKEEERQRNERRREEERKRAREDASGFWGYRYRTTRENNWAYRGEAALTETENWFDVLEVDKSSDRPTIKKAFLTLSKKYHPDTSELPEKEATMWFQKINAAFRVAQKLKRF